MATEPAFEVQVAPDADLPDALVVGIAHPGMAGLTATDYLVRHAGYEEVGHVATRALPDVTPFAEGVPRYPMRVYAGDDPPLSALVSEVFVPVWAADAFVDGLADWAADAGVEEVVVPYGVPFPHGPDEHAVFTVATEAYRERALADADLRPLAGGVLDGVVGELVSRGLDGTVPPVGVYATPVHAPGPDLEAALRLLDALQSVYGFDVPEAELRAQARELRDYYEELTQRMQALGEGEGARGSRDYPEDRMYM